MRDETLAQLAALLGLTYRINHIPEWQRPGVRAPNRPGRKRPGEIPTQDTVHETANPRRGADAHMHELYVRAPNWGGPDRTSYHHVVDDEEAIELLPWQEVAYHGGTPTSNTNWLGTELCVNVDGDWTKTQDNAARLFACKAVKFDKPVAWIVQHNAAYGKDCPAKLRHTPGAWDAFLAKVGEYVTTLNGILSGPGTGEQNPDANGYFTATGYSIGGAIGDYWRANGGVLEFGYPLSNEEAGTEHPWSELPELTGFTCQLFEYRSLAWKAGVGVVSIRTGALVNELA